MQYYVVSNDSRSIKDLLLHIKTLETIYIDSIRKYPFRVLADILLSEYNEGRPKTIILAGKLGFGVLELLCIIRPYIRIVILDNVNIHLKTPVNPTKLSILNKILLEFHYKELVEEGQLILPANELALLC